VRKKGKRKEKLFKTKKEAVAWEAEMKRKPVEEWEEKTDTVCLIDWADDYMSFAKSSFSVKTYEEKRSVFKRFLKEFDPGNPVSQVKMADVMKYIMTQNDKRSGNAANKDRKNLVAAWNWGMKYMNPPLPGPNPCLVERMPEVRQPRYVPPEEDFWKIYEVAVGQDKVMLLSLLHLAARRGEIFRLTWEDVDFGNKRVRLWTSKRKGGVLEFDWLPMTQELRKSLRWWWEHRPIKNSPYVFVCLEEKPFCMEHYGEPFKERSKFMRRICDRAKVKRFVFHAIRHLSASILYNRGYEVAVIQAILRHKSANTTDRYLKGVGLESVREALEDLGPANVKVLKYEPILKIKNKMSKK
jgi:integrase